MAFDKTKFLKRFVEEAREHIQSINDGLLLLEKTPDDSGIINEIFRSAHTIKGSSKIMKLTAVSGLAHRLEDALDALRKGEISFSGGLSDLFFKSIDAVELMLADVQAGNDVIELPELLCSELESAAKGKLPDTEKLEKVVKEPVEIQKPEEDLEAIPSVRPETEKPVELKADKDETIRISEGKLDELINLMGEVVSAHAKIKMRMLELGELEQDLERIRKHLRFSDDGSYKKKEMLVNSFNGLSSGLAAVSTGMNDDIIIQDHLTHELQENALKLRMFPVSTVFNSFSRVVRTMAKATGKKINFTVTGDETELDKKIIEKINDPFIHMIRNSIDHGIESPEIRVKNGKSEAGNMELSAGYESGNVLIKVIDDGSGIPVDKIKARAASRGLFTEAEIEALSEKQIIDLIFHPGFSTSETITDISGRGVGMDVVHNNIVRDLSGSIRVETRKGAGTTFEIRLPLTLAVMHMIVIDFAGVVAAVPSTHVDEIVRVRKSDIIDVVDKKAIKLREQIIPVVKLGDVLELSDWHPDDDEPLIMIASVGNEKMGFIIGALLREENRTIKSLPQHMQNTPFVSGVTVSGNKMLDNVLNLPKIMESAKNVKARIEPGQVLTEAERINILVVDDSISTREIEKSILESYGYNVSLAGDGVEALENADKFQYDLVITDVEMPRMNGLSLTQKLKEKENYKDIPVILISSRDKDEDKRKGLKVGADAYIVKDDFDQNSLIDVIRDLVGG